MLNAKMLEKFVDKTEELDSIKAYLSKSKVLLSNDLLKLSTTLDKVQLDVWDSFKEDGDKVNIYLNQKLLYSNIEIK
jgi:hypothetical protein